MSHPTIVAAEAVEYASFRYDERLPNVLFLVGEIREHDSFDMRRAMREHDIRLVVAASPGGDLHEGLQLAGIFNDLGIATYVPEGANCESSCANVFFGGKVRRATGALGVHQFYSAGREEIPTNETQYTTAEIIGILNTFETPPFVYEKMFSTTGIYYFTVAEKASLARGTPEDTHIALMADVDDFLAAGRSILERPKPLPPAPPILTTPDATFPASAPMEISRFEDVDFFGGDLSGKGVRGISLAECEQICRGNSACAAYSYVKATRWCWPKTGVRNISAAEGVASAILDPTRVDPGIFDRPFREQTAADIPGFDMLPDGLRSTSLADCRRQCAAHGSCVAFSWVAKKNWCFPKYAIGEMRPAIGIITGVRK